MSFKVGDRVCVRDSDKVKAAMASVCLPTYLIGQTGTIIDWIPGFEKVAFDESSDKTLRFNDKGHAIYWCLPGSWLQRVKTPQPKAEPKEPISESINLLDEYVKLAKRVEDLENKLEMMESTHE